MIPILYEANETSFFTRGIGALGDCISALVTEERNGGYELELQYPANGIWAEQLVADRVIKAKANEIDDAQLFQIYNVTRSINGVIKVQAEHISYRLCGVPVKPFSAAGVSAALSQITAQAVTPPGFTFETDFTTTSSYKITTPRSARAVLGGAEGSLLDTFGGELYFDNFKVKYLKSRGSDNGVKIKYGKNLTKLDYEETGAGYNGIFPYWVKDGEGIVYPAAAATSGIGAVARYQAVDFTPEFKQKPTAAQLTARAQTLVNGMGYPVESIEVSFITLHQLKEYETLAALERVALCDYVTVIYPALGIEVRTKVVKTVYNVLTGLYDSVTVGSLQTSIADLVNSTSNSISVGVSACQYKGTATSETAGTSVSQITLNTSIFNTDTANYSISSGGIKIAQEGLYRVSGSAYITPASGTTTLGTYIQVGTSFSGATEIEGCLQGMATTGGRAIQCIPRLVSISANQIVFLGARCRGAAGTCDASNTNTFLQIEKVQ